MNTLHFLFLVIFGVKNSNGNSCHCSVAVLITGRGFSNDLQSHAFAMMRDIIEPLDATVFVATEYTAPRRGNSNLGELLKLLPGTFGERLRTIAVIDGEALVNTTGWSAKTEYLAIPDTPVVQGSGKYQQWLKLKEAWNLMEREERNRMQTFDVVIKLRSDGTPMEPAWDSAYVCAQGATPEPKRVYGATDHIFWGPRSSMAVVAGIFDAIEPWFLNEYKVSAEKPLGIQALLNSMLSMQPRISWIPGGIGGHSNFFYNKLTMAIFPKLIDGSDTSPEFLIKNLEVALAKGMKVTTEAPAVQFGIQAKGAYAADGKFMTEQAFVLWILANHLTLCDLDTATTKYLYKGRVHDRPAPPRCIVSAPTSDIHSDGDHSSEHDDDDDE